MEPLTPASLQGRVPQSCSGCCQQFHCKHFGTRCGGRPAVGAHSELLEEGQAKGLQNARLRGWREDRGGGSADTLSKGSAAVTRGCKPGQTEQHCAVLELSPGQREVVRRLRDGRGRSQTQVPVPRRKPQDQPPAAPVHGEDAAEALSWPPGRGLGQWPSGQHTQLCGCWFSTLLFYVI